MKEIEKLETNPSSGSPKADGPADPSDHPLKPPETRLADSPRLENGVIPEPVEWKPSHWLPCHYFDYMAGTSTGG